MYVSGVYKTFERLLILADVFSLNLYLIVYVLSYVLLCLKTEATSTETFTTLTHITHCNFLFKFIS